MDAKRGEGVYHAHDPDQSQLMHQHWRTIPGFVLVGRTGKTRGRDGEIKFYPEERYLDDVMDSAFLFVESDGCKIPLRIAGLRETGDILISFEGVQDPGAASRFASCMCYLPSDEVRETHDIAQTDDLIYGSLSGYRITDIAHGVIGEIIEVREYPQQEMAVVSYRGREALIPLNALFIKSVSEDDRTVLMDLPEGLLEM